MSIVFYKRPDYISRPDGPLNRTECARYVEKYKHLQGKTPSELSFENVIENKALPPCTLNDFMDYLVYVERSAENLQFYLWLRDYTAKFNALPESEQKLSPEWDENKQPASEMPTRPSKQPSQYAKEINFDGGAAETERTADPGARFSTTNSIADGASFITAHSNPKTVKTMATVTEDANAGAGLKWDAFTIQPFRDDITRVIAHYIAQDSPRELNLSHKDRNAVLHALQHTTHPSAFASINVMVESILKGQAHPNFVRWSVCNGNKPRVIFTRTAASSTAVLCLLIMTILILSRASRWYRLIPCVLLWSSVSAVVASKKGLCMILARNHQRDLKPWELESDLASNTDKSTKRNSKSAKSMTTESEVELKQPHDDHMSTTEKGIKHWTMDSFGTSNSWEQEEWVGRYTKRSWMARAFAGNTWVQSDGVRELQTQIVRESNTWGVLITVILVAGFTAIPNGNFF